MKRIKMKFSLLLVSAILLSGCSDGRISEIRELNKTNVAKVGTCFQMFASRHKMTAPKDKAELVAFLQSGKVDKNLELIGVDLAKIDEMFVSERDGEPLKVKWGLAINPNRPMPIVFESVGVDGVRLVAADELLEVKTDKEYDAYWEGKYSSKVGKKMQQAEGF